MRVGIFLSAQHPPGADPVRALAEHVEQVRFARDNGFSSVHAGQHFLSQPFQMFQSVPLLGRLAAETGELRVGAGIVLLPLLNPVEVAENAATLDAITGGRFILGVGLGYRSEENEAFGVTERRVRVFEEKLEVVRRLLEGAEVTVSGQGYRLEGARLGLLPVQRPRIPVWVAARWPSRRPVRRAARWDGLFPIEVPGPEQLAELVAEVDRARTDAGAFDHVIEIDPGADPGPWAAAGATWVLTSFGSQPREAAVREAIEAGP